LEKLKENEMALLVENHLTDLFSQAETPEGAENPDKAKVKKAAPESESRAEQKGKAAAYDPSIENLKEIVLSIEWEISDATLNRLMTEIDALLMVQEKDNPITLSLKLLGSVGKYLQKNRADAHPESIGFFQEIFQCIEWLSAGEAASEEEKRQRVRENVAKFKSLKEKIATRRDKGPTVRSEPLPSEEKPAKEAVTEAGSRRDEKEGESFDEIVDLMAKMKPQEAFAYMLVEIKKAIREELNSRK
jgi:hypothetical protein